MSKRKTVMTVLSAVLGALFVLCLSSACSRQEKPKAAVEKPRTIEIAPTPLPSTGMVGIVRQADTNLPHYRTPRRSTSTLESKKALRERQRAFAKKTVEDAIRKNEKQMDDLTLQMQAIKAAGSSNEAVKAAAQVLAERRHAYEEERLKLPGMADLWKQREAAKSRLTALRTQADSPEKDAAVKEAHDEINRVGKQMLEIEMAGRENSPSLQQALISLREAEAGREASLRTLAGYSDLERKLQGLMEQDKNLTETQVAMAQEERK